MCLCVDEPVRENNQQGSLVTCVYACWVTGVSMGVLVPACVHVCVRPRDLVMQGL